MNGYLRDSPNPQCYTDGYGSEGDYLAATNYYPNDRILAIYWEPETIIKDVLFLNRYDNYHNGIEGATLYLQAGDGQSLAVTTFDSQYWAYDGRYSITAL